MQHLLDLVRGFREERDWDQYHSPKNLAMALMVEAAELGEHFQWLSLEESCCLDEKKQEQVREEIGDVLIYLVNLSDKLGIDPLQAAYDKLKKNNQKYPAHKVRGKSTKYTEY